MITGPSARTWIALQRQPGVVVWDTDEIAFALAREPHYPRSSATVSLLMAQRESLLRWLERTPSVAAFVSASNHDDAIRIAARIRAKVLQLPNTQGAIDGIR